MKTRVQFVFNAITILLLLKTAPAQQPFDRSALTLGQAVQIALEKNPLRKAALADTRAALAGIREARSALLPRLTFSEAAMRGNDPVYVFGSRLRQQRFTTADFALNRLNTPLPFSNFSTRFAGTWNLFDSFASWHAVTRAKQMNEAAREHLDRADQEVIFRVITAYYGALLAGKQFDVAEQALRTAKAVVDLTQARFDTGLVVESDLLSAKVRLAAREQELIRAKDSLYLARAELNIAMGVPVDSAFNPEEALAEQDFPMPLLTEIEKSALARRPDLKQIESEEAAQHTSVVMVKSGFGPRVNVSAGWELDNPVLIAGGGGNNWLGGIEVQFDLFQGGEKRARLSRELALAERAVAMRQAASDNVLLEVRRAYYEPDASRQQVEVARAAIAEAQGSFRMNQDRYNGGLTTITDLLGAEEASRRSQADYWEAVYHVHTSYASLELASGTLSSHSKVLTP